MKGAVVDLAFFTRRKDPGGKGPGTLAGDLPTEALIEKYTNFCGASGGMGKLGQAATSVFGEPAAIPTWLLLLDLGVSEWGGDVRSFMVDEMINTIEATGMVRTANVVANLLRITVDEREGPTPPAHLRGSYAEFSHGAAQVDLAVVDDAWDLGYFYFTRLDDAVRAGNESTEWNPAPFVSAFKTCWADGNGHVRATNETLQFIVRPLSRAINDGHLSIDRLGDWTARRIVIDPDTFDAVPPASPPPSRAVVPCSDADTRLADLGFSASDVAELKRLDLRRYVSDTLGRLHPSGNLGDDPRSWARLRAAAALLSPTSPAALQTFRADLYDLVQGIADFEPTPAELDPILRAAHSIMAPLEVAAEEGRPMLRQQAAMYLATLADSTEPPSDALVARVVALFEDRDFRGVSPHAQRFLKSQLAAQEG